MSKSYYRNADGMILVYAQDDRASFTFLQSILAEFEHEDGGMGLEQKVNSPAVAAVGTPAGTPPPTRRKKLYLVANKYGISRGSTSISKEIWYTLYCVDFSSYDLIIPFFG
jgi:GTPase SAR1 family protein